MEMNQHTLDQLFAQLGLPSDPEGMEDFVVAHRPLENGTALYRANFWTPAQRAFLKEEIIEDGDWASVIDELNVRLH